MLPRIAILHYTSPPTIGGVESVIGHQVRELSALGYPVRVVSGSGQPFHDAAEFYFDPLFSSKHPDILSVKQSLDHGTIPPAFALLVERQSNALRVALRDCDVCIAHNIHTLNKNLALTAALIGLEKPRMIAFCHDVAWTNPQYQPELHAGYPWALLRQTAPQTRYVTVSQTRRAELAELLGIAPGAIPILSPGIDPAQFFRWTPLMTRLEAQFHLLNADGLLLLPARITRRKNIQVGLHVLAALRQRSGRDFRLIVTGPPGPHNPTNLDYLGELLALRDALGLTDSAHFLYELDDPPLLVDDITLAILYQTADALIFPSLQEGFGIPILEAGLVGIPIFCTPIPPFLETGQSDIHVFDPLRQSPDQIAALIFDTLIQSEVFRLRVRVRHQYRWDVLTQTKLIPLFGGAMSHYNLVIVLSNPQNIESLLTFGCRLLPANGELHLCGLVNMPSNISLSKGLIPARQLRDNISQVSRRFSEVQDDVQVFVDYQPFTRVIDYVTSLDADMLLVHTDTPVSLIGGMIAEEIFEVIPCDVVILSGDGWQQAGDVLLSLRGGPNITLGVRVALALAHDAAITLFHATDQRRVAPDLELIAQSIPQIRRSVTADAHIVDGIISEAAHHKAVVMGASFRKPERHLASGNPVIQEVFSRTHKPVVLVRGANQEPLYFHAPTRVSPEISISTRVDQWFAENTFDSSEFSDLHELMALKEKRGTTISLALPALNEEETVGDVIRKLKTTLMDEFPLLDEIVLIDSNSADNTVKIAEDLGIPVYKHADILRDSVGTYIGKGEALWKSLYVTKGDIVAWVDTDITNIHPRFVYGLIGPLLKRPRIQYVKGFYARPIQIGDKIQAYGGGRVTELVARPLLNLFYPELSGIIQPLSGEYAGRREALEQIPFFTGYGVETGLLIDLLNRYGLDGIAQTDLEMRVHHNQSIVNLSKMSFAILQVFIARIETRYEVRLLERANRSMKLVVQDPDRFALDIVSIADLERPPMNSIATYQERAKPLT